MSSPIVIHDTVELSVPSTDQDGGFSASPWKSSAFHLLSAGKRPQRESWTVTSTEYSVYSSVPCTIFLVSVVKGENALSQPYSSLSQQLVNSPSRVVGRVVAELMGGLYRACIKSSKAFPIESPEEAGKPPVSDLIFAIVYDQKRAELEHYDNKPFKSVMEVRLEAKPGVSQVSSSAKYAASAPVAKVVQKKRAVKKVSRPAAKSAAPFKADIAKMIKDAIADAGASVEKGKSIQKAIVSQVKTTSAAAKRKASAAISALQKKALAAQAALNKKKASIGL